MTHVTLMGAEDVRNAGNAMREAASQMQRAAESMEESLERQRRFMDEWLQRYQDCAALAPNPKENDRCGFVGLE